VSFVATFMIGGDLYVVTDNNEIYRWDTDEAEWVRAGEIDRR